jgi:hypothetical protein
MNTAPSVADSLIASMKEWIEAAVSPLTSEIAALRKQIDDMPVPKDGERGSDGIAGKDGVSVDIAEIRAEVMTRVDKFLDGIELPRDGRDGPQGIDGRDAVAIQIHPAIDETRSYPKNTYASHKGGLWRATGATHGLEGWEPIIEGIAEIAERHVGEREIETKYVLSSGREIVAKRTTSEMIYRGVWREGAYKHGDVVTWSGSTWHCNEDTATRPETVEGAKAWTLCTKRGDKGRDAPLK